MTKHRELIDLWRKTTEPNFTVWLSKQEKKCEFCEASCGKPWCVVVEETFEEFDVALEELSKEETNEE